MYTRVSTICEILEILKSESISLKASPCPFILMIASQCGYVVSTLASRQGDQGSNPRAARKSCEVYPGLGILQPQWNPYPTLTPPSC